MGTLIKDNLKKFTLKNRQRLAFYSLFWVSVPFSYCLGKEGKSKNTPYVCRDPEYDVAGRSRNAVSTSVPQL